MPDIIEVIKICPSSQVFSPATEAQNLSATSRIPTFSHFAAPLPGPHIETPPLADLSFLLSSLLPPLPQITLTFSFPRFYFLNYEMLLLIYITITLAFLAADLQLLWLAF